MRKFLYRLLMFVSGTAVVYISGFVFDYLLYPFVIYQFRLVKGFFIMTFLSFVFNLCFLLLYNYLEKDIFAIEYSKRKINALINDSHGTWAKRMRGAILRKSRILLFIFLSVYNPFIATIYGIKKDPDDKRKFKWHDLEVFLLSLIIGNIVWAPSVFAGVTFLQFVHNSIFQ